MYWKEDRDEGTMGLADEEVGVCAMLCEEYHTVQTTRARYLHSYARTLKCANNHIDDTACQTAVVDRVAQLCSFNDLSSCTKRVVPSGNGRRKPDYKLRELTVNDKVGR
jgi:hypothetical protein